MGEINSFPIQTKEIAVLDAITNAQSEPIDKVLVFDESVGVWKSQTLAERDKAKVIPIDDITDFASFDFDQVENRQQFHLNSFAPNGQSGGGSLLWGADIPKMSHDGIIYFSPTVPAPADFDNPADVQNYRNGVGEEFPTEDGVFVLTSYSIESSETPSIDGAIAVWDGESGTRLKNGVVPTDAGNSVISIDDAASVGYVRLNSDNTASRRTLSEHKTDLGLNNVDNTSDVNKPISTAQQSALDLKAPRFNIDSVAVLSATAPVAGQVYYLKEYNSGTDKGGGQLLALSGVVTPDNAATFASATAGVYFKRINASIFNPEHAGAYGNGINDDYQAWQRAVDAFSSVNGASGSIYNFSDKVIVSSNRRINLNGSRIVQTSDQREVFDCSGSNNVHIFNGNFVGKSEASFTNSSSSRAIAIKAGGASNICIFNNKFENFWYSPLSVLTEAQNVIFCRNTVIGPGSSVLGVDINRRNCTGATILGNGVICAENEIYEVAQGFIIAEGSQRVILANNNIHNIINEHGIYVDTAVRDLNITGNVIKTADGNGIKVQYYTSFGGSVKNINISNNSIFDCANLGGDAIIVYNVTPGGTPLYAENVVISNNNINGVNVGLGINLRYIKDLTISSNQITHCETSNGISFTNCERVKVSLNNINDTYKTAIYSSTNTGVEISSNTIRNPATGGFATDDYGIYSATTDDLTVRNNSVYGLTGTTRYCLFIASGTQSTHSVTGNLLLNAEEYAIRLAGTSAMREYRDNILSGVIGESFNEPALIAVASAATIKIPTGQRFVRVTGTTNITTIDPMGHSGNTVTLIFAAALTVTRGSTIQISTDFVTTLNDTLTISSDGNNWYENCRSVN